MIAEATTNYRTTRAANWRQLVESNDRFFAAELARIHDGIRQIEATLDHAAFRRTAEYQRMQNWDRTFMSLMRQLLRSLS